MRTGTYTSDVAGFRFALGFLGAGRPGPEVTPAAGNEQPRQLGAGGCRPEWSPRKLTSSNQPRTSGPEVAHASRNSFGVWVYRLSRLNGLTLDSHQLICRAGRCTTCSPGTRRRPVPMPNCPTSYQYLHAVLSYSPLRLPRPPLTLSPPDSPLPHRHPEDQGFAALLARHVDVPTAAWHRLLAALGAEQQDGQFWQ